MASRRRGRVRVVGRITPFPDLATPLASSGEKRWVSVVRTGVEEGCGSADVVFRDRDESATPSRRDSYKLDWCYEQDEGVSKIISEEVRPLIQGIFQGADASVIACGARGSGKTLLIEGSEERPGLAPLAMAEILTLCDETANTVKVSCYGVYQDHVFDLLQDKEQKVQILEDASGKTQLKGLSQVPVKSISDFNQFYFHGRKQQKSPKKDIIDVKLMTQGVIIYVCSVDKEINPHLAGRINFVDLAGYVDLKQKGNAKPKIFETSTARINKSLYALQNVICALNANEVHVPYRGSRLTHLLKDFTNKENSQALMIACLRPTPCPETIEVASIASRSCAGTTKTQIDSAKKSKSVVRPSPLHTSSKRRLQMLASVVKKPEASRFGCDKKPNGTPSASKTRRFSDKIPVAKIIQDKPLSKVFVELEALTCNEDKPVPIVSKVEQEALADNEHETLSRDTLNVCPSLSEEGNSLGSNASQEETTTITEDGGLKDHGYVSNIHESSPPLSERLREISNSLKLLSCQPANSTPSIKAACSNQNLLNSIEPKTPGIPFKLQINYDQDNEVSGTPHDIFKTHSVEVKKTLVQGLLTYLNSASKEELKNLKGIGERRANYIIELREESPQFFKDVNDLRQIGLPSKQVKEMMKSIMGEFYT